MILALHDLPLLFHVLPAVSLGHCAQHSYLCEKYVCVSFQRSVVYNRSCIFLRPCAQIGTLAEYLAIIICITGMPTIFKLA